MKKVLTTSIYLFVGLFLLASTALASHQITHFRDNKNAALSLTFDDGWESQFSTGVPLLNSRNLKGTFFLISSWAGIHVSWNTLRQVASQGHEIGSHSITHPDLTTLSQADLIGELSESQRLINQDLPSQSCVSLAYPYGSSNNLVQNISSNYYIAARGEVASEGGLLNYYVDGPFWKAVNFLNVGSYAYEEGTTTISDLDYYLKYAEQHHAWFDVHFHSINNTDSFTQLLDHFLTRNVWVDTFGSIVRYMQERMSSTITVFSEGSTEIKLNLSHSLDNYIYKEILTIRSTIPNNWRTAKVEQGSNIYTVDSMVEGAETVIYYNAIPNDGVITITGEITITPLTQMELNFEEGSGNTALDSSGYGNQGAINGAAYTTESAVGIYALSFAGTDSVVVDGNGSLKPGNISVAFWVKHMSDTSSPNYGGIIQGAYGNGYSTGFRVLDYYNQPLAQMNFGDAGPVWIVGNPLAQGAWTHIVLTYDHAKVRLYQNAMLVREIPESRDINWGNLSNLYIGLAQWYLTGSIDKVKMYNYALNSQEIGELYDEKARALTVMELNFEEGSGNTTLDSSAYGNQGTINGAVYTAGGAVGTYALSFDGTASVTVPGNASLKPSNISVAFWVKQTSDTSSPNYGGIIQGAYGNGYSTGFRILDYNNRTLAQMNFGDAGPVWILGNPLAQGAWTHIVLTYDHAKVRMYENAVLVREVLETRDINWHPNPYNLYIGLAQWYFKGVIDQVKMFDYALSLQEIIQLHNE